MVQSRRFLLSRSKALKFLDELEKADNDAISLYMPNGLSISEIEDSLEKVLDVQAVPPEISELIADSETGAALFWGSARRCLIVPPFPMRERYYAQGYDVEPLRTLLKRDFTIVLVLIRLGAYAIGVSQGEQLITSKVGTGLIHSRHRQGGSSAHRFERHREKQIEYFLNRVCGHIREQLEPHAKAIDYMLYGGAKTTIQLIKKQCPFLEHFEKRTLPPLLTIPDPRQSVLEAAIGQVWSSQVIEWHNG